MTTHDPRANPFGADDPDRRQLWEMLVDRDIQAFVAGDFERVADDFDPDRFTTVTGNGQADPDLWTLALTSLAVYRSEWLRQSDQFRRDFDDPASVLYAATRLEDIEIRGDFALAHKRFDHVAQTRAGALVPLRWRTLYQCRRSDDADAPRWRITGFIGYLPLSNEAQPEGPAVQAPVASQHRTAGAYSPVLRIEPRQLVVISGQAALDPEGQVVGDDVESQTEHTLDSCRRALAAAGLGLADVFKTNVYLADISDWAAFDRTYRRLMPGASLPVRTAIGAHLLPGLKVEVEMWAAR